MKFYPFLLSYHTRDYIWGGVKLKKCWNKKSECSKIAESWELSVNPKSQSYILNGELKGKLSSLIKQYPEILGKKGMQKEVFPVLIKLINAAKPLSVQVHPDDDYAMQNENQLGKCEMWYVCENEENGAIYLGLNKDMTKEQIKRAIEDNTIENYLNKIDVKKGQYYLVPQGALHAIRAGVTLLEIQQNSDVTYRVYDYDRTDHSGNKRELHIDKALDVIDCQKFELPKQNMEYTLCDGYKVRKLAECEYFKTKEYIIEDMLELYDNQSFIAFTVIEGKGTIGEIDVQKGSTVFLPANCNGKIKGQMTIVTVNL